MNDYCLIALTSVIMKCFEQLEIIHLLLAASHPGPYAVWIPVQQVYDAIALTMNAALSHLNTYARILFIDYSSAFNTIIPSRLVSKLVDLGLSTSLCKWIFHFLTGRPQVLRIGDCTLSTLMANTGTQGCVLNHCGPSGRR